MSAKSPQASRAEFSETELEAIGLKALTDCLDAMVNHAVLTLRGEDPNTEIVFESHIHQRYFTALVVDFLAKPDKKMFELEGSYLEVLQTISSRPVLGSPELAEVVSVAVRNLESWLDEEIVVEIWLPSIDRQAALKIKREEFVWITGNASKHNFTRLSRVAGRLVDIFERNAMELDPHTALLVLDDFYERFHNDILIYHASTLVELLNLIRWSIHEYLLPHFNESYTESPEDPPLYTYQVPDSISHKFARTCYWDLMNEVHSTPPLRPFHAPWYLKGRY